MWAFEIAVMTKSNRREGFSRVRAMRWFPSNDLNSAWGLIKFYYIYLGERYQPCNRLRLHPTENIMHNMHKA